MKSACLSRNRVHYKKVHTGIKKKKRRRKKEQAAENIQRENSRDTVVMPRLGDPQTVGHSIPQRPSVKHQ